MTEQRPDQPPKPEEEKIPAAQESAKPPRGMTNTQIRVLGVVILGLSIFIATALSDYVIDGILPAPWLGYCGIVAAVVMMLNPGAYRSQFSAFYGRRRP